MPLKPIKLTLSTMRTELFFYNDLAMKLRYGHHPLYEH